MWKCTAFERSIKGGGGRGVAPGGGAGECGFEIGDAYP